jgi:hypothetical protein
MATLRLRPPEPRIFENGNLLATSPPPDCKSLSTLHAEVTSKVTTLSRKPDHSSFVTYIVHVMRRLCDVAHLSLELRICENDRT